jgi:hypothetical protein
MSNYRPPLVLNDDGTAYTPIEYREIRDRDRRIRALVEHAFRDARHRGARR